MVTLVEFILERVSEDEAEVTAFDKEWKTTTVAGDVPQGLAYITDNEYMSLLVEPARVLAECEAKRRIVARCTSGLDPQIDEFTVDSHDLARDVLRHIAAVYADHADYQPEWKP